MSAHRQRSAILVTSYPGQPGVAELRRLGDGGEQPRKDYVELARVLDADVIDNEYMERRAHALARLVARRTRLHYGQVVEAFLRRRRYRTIVAWADRLGLPLALLFKLTRSRRDLALISAYSTRGKKAFVLRTLKAHSHLGALIYESSVQMRIAATRLHVPPEKLHLDLPGVDDRFWRPDATSVRNMICAVGWEARDYATLARAIEGLHVEVAVVVGSTVPVIARLEEMLGSRVPENLTVRQGLSWQELRRLYAESRFVVVPMHDVEFNAGVTAMKEAMAMRKALVVSRTRGQMDFMQHEREGLFVPPGDVGALRAAIRRLLDHPEQAAEMGRRGRALVEECFGLDTCIARLAVLVRGQGTESAASPGPRGAGAPSDDRRATELTA